MTTAAPSAVPTATVSRTPQGDVRRLVTVETIRAISPIPGADAIEAATVRGWTVVVKKGEFSPGDGCIYFEIDSALPVADDRFAFLASRGTKTLEDGTVVHRLKTAKLRGVYSQGLVIGLAAFAEELAALDEFGDLADLLGVRKYEPPLPAGMDIAGEFPRHLARKTDSERAQNLTDAWPGLLAAGPWEATEKVDGSSLTVARDTRGEIHVCSRNYELHDGNNLYWNAVRATGILEHVAGGEVIQGEVVGPGVQKNPLGLPEVRVLVFAVTRDGVTLPREQWPTWIASPVVAPLVAPVPVYDLALPATAEESVRAVDGIASLVAPGRKAEGVVWHRANGEGLDVLEGRSTFKTISNRYLLKHDD